LKISIIPFDSQLFGYPVGKVEISDDWNEEEFLEESRLFRLTYIFSGKKQEINSKRILQMDNNITFEKELEDVDFDGIKYFKYTGNWDSRLLNLAFESGKYSRFKTDPRLCNGEFQNLYHAWIQRDFENKNLFVSGEFQGFASFNLFEHYGKISLIAVEEKNRGRGIGKNLLESIESYAFQNQSSKLIISTQKSNSSAVKLYESLGYSLMNETFIYHCWNPSV
jgi:dTDP-4-amino-4,6-dideoxy-D-galactose acyltransferase